MKRRALFGRIAAVAAGVALAPSVEATVAQSPEEAFVEKVLANPDQYPEIMAQARELMGEPGYPIGMLQGFTPPADYRQYGPGEATREAAFTKGSAYYVSGVDHVQYGWVKVPDDA